MAPLTAGWDNFFVAEVGAAAALTGLIFVAVSINLTRILAVEHLPERAGETLVVLLGVLAVATFGLVPGQGHAVLGGEVAATGLAVWGFTLRAQVRAWRHPVARQWVAARAAWTQVASLPFVIAGGLLIAGRDVGLYWIVPGMLASFSSSILSAWVLLVEILR